MLRIGHCPPITPGPGQIVTATFTHEADGELVTVVVGGAEIGCTANHPFWSEDRQQFVQAGQLRQGERVRTRLEQVADVVAIKPRPPTQWVYNLEVQGEHVYEVGPGGVLVHNRCLTNNEVSRIAEQYVEKWYGKTGWTVLEGGVRNNSNHGIDVILKRKTKDGWEYLFVEVKANTARLRGDQKEGAEYLVMDRLKKAADGKRGHWKNVSAKTAIPGLCFFQ